MYKEVFFLVTVLLCMFSCKPIKHINEITEPCFYRNLNKDSIIEPDASICFEQIKDNNRYVKIYYSSFDNGGEIFDSYKYVLHLYNDKYVLYKFDYKNQISSTRAINNVEINELINDLLSLHNKFQQRKCLIEGGASGTLAIYNEENLVFYFDSDGYECDVLDENNRVKSAAKLIQIMKNP